MSQRKRVALSASHVIPASVQTSSPQERLSWQSHREGNPLLLRGYRPSLIGIELGHGGCCLCCISSQILLQQDAVLVDDERHHAGVAIFSGIGNEGKPAGHLSIDDVVLGAAGYVRALASE